MHTHPLRGNPIKMRSVISLDTIRSLYRQKKATVTKRTEKSQTVAAKPFGKSGSILSAVKDQRGGGFSEEAGCQWNMQRSCRDRRANDEGAREETVTVWGREEEGGGERRGSAEGSEKVDTEAPGDETEGGELREGDQRPRRPVSGGYGYLVTEN